MNVSMSNGAMTSWPSRPDLELGAGHFHRRGRHDATGETGLDDSMARGDAHDQALVVHRGN